VDEMDVETVDPVRKFGTALSLASTLRQSYSVAQ